ncbi:MAG: hypothetical protein LBD50_01615 [Rickettsiales bacterium]|nr:hypothetical protein [Rickettsiales bacterium]
MLSEISAVAGSDKILPDEFPQKGSVLREFADTAKVPGILKRNFNEMLDMAGKIKQTGNSPVALDEFYHRKAQYEAAQLGLLPAAFGQILGLGKKQLIYQNI